MTSRARQIFRGTCLHSYYAVDQSGRGLAYFYGQIRKKEKKFYILNQDYASDTIGDSFKHGLKEFYLEAQIVGEDYHKLFLTDFAPYMTKVKASGAEVIFTPTFSRWLQPFQTGTSLRINLPFANIYMNDLHAPGNGHEGTRGFVHIDSFDMPNPFKLAPGYARYYQAWTKPGEMDCPQQYPVHAVHRGCRERRLPAMGTYWLLSVMERAKSTDPEKIIKLWEGDSYRYVNGKVVKMRACDHKAIMISGCQRLCAAWSSRSYP